MDLSQVLTDLGGLAAKIAPAILPGAGPIIGAGKAIADAFATVKQLNGGEAPADAEAKHQALVAKVNAHADSTFDRAERGDG